VAGSFADRRGPDAVIRIGALLVFGSFLAMAIAPPSLALLLVATIVFDLGVQASLIAHQSIVYGLDDSARSRLNAVLVSTMFAGMAVGSATAARLVERWGLTGIAVLGAVSSAAAWSLRRFSQADERQRSAGESVDDSQHGQGHDPAEERNLRHHGHDDVS